MTAKSFEEFDKWLEGRGLSIEKTADGWGQPRYLHPHIQSMFDGWNASRAAQLVDTDVAGLVGSLRNTGDRTLSNVGFSTSGESAVAFGALLLNSASALEALSAKLAGHERELEKARQLFYEAAEQRNNALKRLSERRKRK